MPAPPAKVALLAPTSRKPFTFCSILSRIPLPPMVIVVLALCSIAGCSTRQLNESVSGSTAQRLVTYSLEKFIREITNQTELTPIKQKTVNLNVHFLADHVLLDYATRLLAYHLENRYQIELSDHTAADFELNVFFNSMGTDYDSYGLSLPGFGLAATPDSRINILSIDMFHGVTEGFAIIKNNRSGTTDRTQRLLARVRADNVATPILDFPVNQLD